MQKLMAGRKNAWAIGVPDVCTTDHVAYFLVCTPTPWYYNPWNTPSVATHRSSRTHTQPHVRRVCGLMRLGVCLFVGWLCLLRG